MTNDVLVVGAGLAGFSAAVRASEQGAKVLLIDKSSGDGNILMASGSLRAGVKIDEHPSGRVWLDQSGEVSLAPAYGLRVVPGITFTISGILIDGRARALNQDERPIPGLYAAGDAIGGLMGGYRGGYTGGLVQAVITGILAGENAARERCI